MKAKNRKSELNKAALQLVAINSAIELVKRGRASHTKIGEILSLAGVDIDHLAADHETSLSLPSLNMLEKKSAA